MGESGARLVCVNLAASPLKDVKRVLDFGCGWGRVGRHLRALFPSAELLFCELNKPAAAFCAETFNGTVVSEADLPAGIDIIWLGSVFTHIDYGRMQTLFDRLVGTLSVGGVLIATFHGRRAIEISKRSPYMRKELWEKVVAEYHSTGTGYASYGIEELGDYGASLTTPERVIALGEKHGDIRLLSYSEAGWSNHQDVGSWTRWTLRD